MPSERGLAHLKKLFVAIILLAITLSVVVAFAASGNPAPADLKITTSDGEEMTLSSLLSQHDYVILNIFQPGNTASSMELPWFESIHASLPGNIKVVAVTSESASDLSSYKTSFGLSFPIGFSADLTAFLAGKGVDIKDYPTTLVINKQGSIIYTQAGYFRLQSQLRSVVDYLQRYPSSSAATSYTLVIRNRDNQPIPGVVVYFYGAGVGQMLTSDEDGLIVFTAAPADYHYQVMNDAEEVEGKVESWTMVEV